MGKFTAFVMGGLVGACAALALAPRTGEEARAAVASKVAGVKDSVAGMSGQSPQQVYQDVTAAAATFVQDAAAKGQEVYSQAAGRVQETVASNGSSDELRAKIEAARARITEQMMANIDESRDAVDAVEAEVEEVEAQPEATEEVVEAEVEEATEE